MQKEERRHYPRTAVACPARILGKRDKLMVKGKTVDISAGGVKVLGPGVHEPKVGGQVRVEINLCLPGQARPRRISREATVRRVEVMGEWTAVSLQFAELVEME